ncbi:condensation domain-containing protein [Streptomyces sp. NBC_01261]|uniref:condensation domain-containing protein n=1 Tax=unclassified Streptomyces TaxID=2593676 RepID=UPI002E2AD5BE|nr:MULTISPECIES: condensation domain-containing protein [unclassified Streptomyces]
MTATNVPIPQVVDWLRAHGGPVGTLGRSRLLKVPAGLGADALTVALQALVDHHDALRLVARRTDGRWSLVVRDPGAVRAADLLDRTEARGLDGPALRAAVRVRSARSVAELDPEAGVLARVVWFDAGADHPGRLLLTIHQLAVDDASWRILLSDLGDAWRAAADGVTPVLAPVPTPLGAWPGHCRPPVAEPARTAEPPSPEGMPTVDPPLSDAPLHPARDTRATSASLVRRLPADLSADLSTVVADTFLADPEDVLLTALALAVAQWRREQQLGADTAVLVDVPDRCRRHGAGAPDVSRTVGWLTAPRPVRIAPALGDRAGTSTGGPALAGAVRRVGEQLRNLPAHGTDRGGPRRPARHTAVAPDRYPRPQIGFTHLGRTSVPGDGDTTAGDDGLWRPAVEQDAVIDGTGDSTPLWHTLEVTTVIEDHADGPRLSATWTWAAQLMSEEDVRDIAEAWVAALSALAAHAGRSGADDPRPAPCPPDPPAVDRRARPAVATASLTP